MMRRRSWILALAGAMVTPLAMVATDAPAPTSAEAAGSPQRANVVLITVDDMRADELRFMPRTTRLLGEQGVTFANSLSPNPLCCPARASLLGGQYTHNHRVFSNDLPYAFSAFDDRSTLATWLRDAGYETVMLGKYLNGYGKWSEFGEDDGTSLDYVPPGWTQWRAAVAGLPKTHPDHGDVYDYLDITLSDDGRGFTNYEGQYQTTVLGNLSVDVISAQARSPKPFFLYASYMAPHTGRPPEPDDPEPVLDRNGRSVRFGTPARPARFRGIFDDSIRAAPGASWHDPDISDKPEYLRSLPLINDAERAALLELARQRAESLAVVDRQVERTVNALAATGELDQTLLVFTSDNGYFLGEQGIRQGKILPHDPSLRTPLVIRGPDIPAGEVRYDPFLTIDVAPTIASLADVSPTAPVDGVSMLEVARSGDLGWKRAVLTETGPRGAVRDTDESGRPLDVEDPGPTDVRWAIGIRTDRYLYVDLATKEEELYDMATDPDQYHNLAADPAHADLLAMMRDQLRLMRACDAAACRAPLPRSLATEPGESIVRGR